MVKIESSQNKSIKYIQKLRKKKYRELYREYILEGFKLIDEAVKSKANVQQVYIASHKLDIEKERMDYYNSLQIPTFEVEDSIFKKLSSMENSEGILAIAGFIEIEELHSSNVLLLDAVQDPGNLGTIIRTGDAAGFTSILCSKGCADIYNEKTIRATMGSLFHLSIRNDLDLLHEISSLKEEGYSIIGSDLSSLEDYRSIVEKKKYALIIGNESNGIRGEILRTCDKRVKIPIYGQAESLNASVAAAILMYHIAQL